MSEITSEQTTNFIYNNISQPAYEGASTNYRMSQEGLLNGDVDSLASRELLNLQMRIAHAVRNNGYARTALNKYVTNLSAIKVKWLDAEGNKHPLMQELWDEFAANPNIDGYGTLANTQSGWHSSMFLAGNAFTRFLIRKTKNKNRVPLKLQGIPATMHDILYMGEKPSDKIRTGMRFSDFKPTSYFFRKGIYEEQWNGITNLNNHTEVKANELLHLFVRDSPEQWLGIPSMAAVLLPLYEIDELLDATVAKQKAAQAIAWIVENSNPMSLTPTGSPSITNGKDGEDKIVFKATGGNTQYLNKGEKINFYQSTDIGANLPILINSELRRIASTLDVPYHSLTGDTGDLDFSSLRAIAVELRQRLEFIHHFYTIPLGLAPLTTVFKSLAELSYDVSTAVPSYQLPRWYGVDDLKDTQADLLEVQNGMATLESKLDERHTSFEEIIADRERMREMGLDSLLQVQEVNTNQSNNIEANSNSTGD